MTDFSRINTVASLSPAPVTLDAIRRIVREEIRANAALEAAARQALEALIGDQDLIVETAEKHWEYKTDLAIAALRAALAQHSPAALFDPRGSLGEPIV